MLVQRSAVGAPGDAPASGGYAPRLSRGLGVWVWVTATATVPTPSVRVTCRDTTVIVIVDMLIPPMGNNCLIDRRPG